MTREKTENVDAIHRLVRASAKIFARHDADLGAEMEAILPFIRARFAPKPANGLAPPMGLAGNEVGTDNAPLRCMEECAHLLHWRRPGFGQLPDAISASILVTEVLGPDGMVKHESLRFGALYQGAGHYYPEHSHRADEVYYVLGGTGLWSIENAPAVRRGAGSFIHHAPSVMHSIHTLEEPVLTLWVWRGDIGAQSYRLK